MKNLSAIIFKIGKRIGLEFLFARILRKVSPDLIFCFHEVQEARLNAQIKYLKRIYVPQALGYVLERRFGKGTGVLKAPNMAFTLDDCLKRDMNIALPLFARENTPCTFFVPTNYADGAKPMWPNKLRVLCAQSDYSLALPEGEKIFGSVSDKEIFFDQRITKYLYSPQTTSEIEEEVDNLLVMNKVMVPAELRVISAPEILVFQKKFPGIADFQSHTMSHLKLSISDPDIVEKEFVGSKTYLNDLTCQSQDVVCYPYGSAWHIGNTYLIAKKHYRYGLTLIKGVLMKGIDPHFIPRIALYHKDDELRVALKILTAILYSVLKRNRPIKKLI